MSGRVLVTGGAGFIGSHLAAEYQRAGWDVTVLDDLSRGRESNVPPGCSSVQVEIYFSPKYRPFTGKPADYIEPAIRDLIRCGVLRESDKLLLKDAVYCPYANIVFDHDRAAAVATVHGYLDAIGIQHCGRFGDWGYLWTDDSIKSGETAAQRAVATL